MSMASVTCGRLPTRVSDSKYPYGVTAVELPATCSVGSTASTESLCEQIPSMKKVDLHSSSPGVREDSSNNNIYKQHTSTSRPTSSAHVTHSRSASHSASRPTSSRRSSLHSSRRAVPNTAIVPVHTARSTPQERRETLLALHRESVRLFQDQDASRWSSSDDTKPAQLPPSSPPGLQRASSSTTYRTRNDGRASWEQMMTTTGSAPPSPIASKYPHPYSTRPQSSRAALLLPPAAAATAIATTSTAAGDQSRPLLRERSHTLPNANQPLSSSSTSGHIPATTIIEWTSPSTRRREYEKIDRASRGMRGLWRRVAPRWCRARDGRTPFFEEGKMMKVDREGSVRRFRMDLPDHDHDPDHHDEDEDYFGKTRVQVVDCVPNKREQGAGRRRRWS